MTALTASRLTPTRLRTRLNRSVAASALCHAGALAVLDASGDVKPGVTATGLRGLGRFMDMVDNSTGSAGDKTAEIGQDSARFENSAGGDELTAADIGEVCYVVDDQTVAKTSGGGTRSIAGLVADVDDQGVWIDFLVGAAPGVNKLYLPVRIDDLVAADAKVYGVSAPRAGTITKIFSSLEGHALATGDATITGEIGATAITNGVVTITNAGSAVGDADSAVPTAANAVSAGDRIDFTVGGANTNAAAFAMLVVEITY